MRNHSILALVIIALLAGTATEAKYSGGTGEPNDPYRIATAQDMQQIGANSSDWNKHFILVNNVNLARVTQFNIIGTSLENPFQGVFDGNDHKVWNFTWTSTGRNYIGLFGYVGGQVKNLAMENVNVNAVNGYYVGGLVGWNEGTITNCYSTGSVTGDYYVGGLVGRNYGTITNCYATDRVSGDFYVGGLVGINIGTITNCYATGSVSGEFFVGGLVGQNYGTITNCYSTGSVTGSDRVGGLVGEHNGTITNCYSTGRVTGGNFVGRLVGSNWGTITNCYSTGSVTGDYYVGGLVGINNGMITDCYSTGSVTGDYYVGGLVGERSNEGTTTASFWDVETSGKSTSAGGIGKSTAEMKTKSTFTSAGWDFVGETANGSNDIWRMCVDGVDYPLLSRQFIDGDFACPDGVDILDLEFFVERWIDAGCDENNNFCNYADINYNGLVNFDDFATLASHWLEGM
jgi:hypothetical protein